MKISKFTENLIESFQDEAWGEDAITEKQAYMFRAFARITEMSEALNSNLSVVQSLPESDR